MACACKDLRYFVPVGLASLYVSVFWCVLVERELRASRLPLPAVGPVAFSFMDHGSPQTHRPRAPRGHEDLWPKPRCSTKLSARSGPLREGYRVGKSSHALCAERERRPETKTLRSKSSWAAGCNYTSYLYPVRLYLRNTGIPLPMIAPRSYTYPDTITADSTSVLHTTNVS